NICHWLTVMAPAQQISVQDLPPEVLRTAVDAPSTVSAAQTAAAPAQAHEVVLNSTAAPAASAVVGLSESVATPTWESLLEAEARHLLQSDCKEVWDVLSQRFESSLIVTALSLTHGKRMEAAQRLGIGRNTITRKIQELGLDSPD